MTVRAKFVVDTKMEDKYQKGMQNICLMPVYSDEEGSENKKFWEATPAGSIQLSCINPAASEQFVVGQEYYVDFTKA